MSKTKEITVFVTCDTEDEFDEVVDNIADLVATWSGGLAATAWDATPDDED